MEHPTFAIFYPARKRRTTLGLRLPRKRSALRIDGAQLRTRYRSSFDADGKAWLPIGELARLSGDEECSAWPADALTRITCRARVPKRALPTLEAYLALVDVADMRATENDAGWEAFAARERPPELVARLAQSALGHEASVKHDEPAQWKGLAPGKARVQILFHRLLARWAAQARTIPSQSR
jgi:hypothetical protein